MWRTTVHQLGRPEGHRLWVGDMNPSWSLCLTSGNQRRIGVTHLFSVPTLLGMPKVSKRAQRIPAVAFHQVAC